MDDRELDLALRSIAAQRQVPPDRIVHLTKTKVRGRRIIQVVSLLSLLAQLVFFGFVALVLAAPGVETEARLAGAISLFAYLGCIVVIVVAAREHVKGFFRRVEYLAG